MTVRLVTVDLAAMTAALLAEEQMFPRLSMREAARAERMAQGSSGAGAANQWRAAHVALRWVLEQFGDEDLCGRIRGEEFQNSKTGKPYLPGAALSFSLSHGGGYALIAVSTDGDVGVDVDGDRRRALRMSLFRKRHLVQIAAALASLAGADGEAQSGGRERPASVTLSDNAGATVDEATLLAWVVIEAFAKAAGTGVGAVLEACRHSVEEAFLGAYGAWRAVVWQIRGDVFAAAAIPKLSGAPEWLNLSQELAEGRVSGLRLVPAQ